MSKMSMRYMIKKLADREKLRKAVIERVTEPLHLNIASLFAAMGPFRVKVLFDLVLRPQYAYGVLRAAEIAADWKVKEIACIELGVASGAGLMNMADIARRAERATGVRIRVHGFDSGSGMPPPADVRDHPELYSTGDFPMDPDAIAKNLPSNAELHRGLISETIGNFLKELDCPIGFVALDVDYYSSSIDALRLLEGDPELYVPATLLYVDDIHLLTHNIWCGELLAISEFNLAHDNRKISPYTFLRAERIMKNAAWIDHFFIVHILDHPLRSGRSKPAIPQRIIENPYLR